MPKNKSAVIRHRIINNCLRDKRKKFPSLVYLADECSRVLDTEVSTSTIEKDIRLMKQDRPVGYAAPIIFNRAENGYAYAEPGYSIDEVGLEPEEWEAIRYAALLLFQYKEVPVFANFKAAVERIDASLQIGLDLEDPFLSRKIQFEQPVSLAGYEWLGDISGALKAEELIQFSYENIYKNEIKSYTALPVLLREQKNRWYLLAWVEEREQLLTFALDRIRELQRTGQRKKLKMKFDPDSFLRHAVGIIDNEGEPSRVRLRIKTPYHKLVALDPLHHSQHILETNSKSCTLELQVHITHELHQRLLSFGAYCVVLTPASLKKEIKEQLAAALKNYP
ncbi:MAG: WYL domain-containing protein [Chitinophagaceae bacterium]|nr:WYL domain-containing protein [Chitinophagaceae bacterium]